MYYRSSVAKQWCHSMPGSMLLEMEQEQLADLLSHIYGNYLLQIGGGGDLSLAQSSPINNHVLLGANPQTQHNHYSIESHADELPLLPLTMDAVLVMHRLEFLQNPERLLKEIHTVLVENGQLIILGFNPWSLWGVTRALSCNTSYPWNGHFWSAGQLKRWLRKIGYSIIVHKTLCFRPPIKDQRWERRLLFMEPIGQLCVPNCGAAYLLVAQKKVPGMTPLKVNWWPKKIPVRKGYAEPAPPA